LKAKKNVLIISYGYPPLNDAGAQRPYAIAKNLDKSKFNIKVIVCQNPNSVMGLNINFDPILGGVSIIKVKSYIGSNSNNFRDIVTQNTSFKSKIKSLIFKVGQKLIFPDKGMFWFPKVKAYLKENKALINNTDIIISTSPGVTNHRIAKYIKRKNKKSQWLADFRDFNYVEHWEDKNSFKAFLHKKLELSIIKEATHLSFVTQTMYTAYQKFYPKFRAKMHYIYNGFDKQDFYTKAVPVTNTNTLNFFYAGSFYNGLRSPFPLMQLLDRALQENVLSQKEIVIQIAGNLDEEMRSEMTKYKSYPCVVFLGRITRVEVIEYMSKAIFLWLIVANIKSHYQTVPIKLFEYIAARRPIINFAPNQSESSQIIKENKLGYNFETINFNLDESYSEFKKMIVDFKNGKYNESLSEDGLVTFAWEKQIDKIEKLF